MKKPVGWKRFDRETLCSRNEEKGKLAPLCGDKKKWRGTNRKKYSCVPTRTRRGSRRKAMLKKSALKYRQRKNVKVQGAEKVG